MYYFLEYTPRMRSTHSATNDLVLNLKKPVSHRGQSDWVWKERAIDKVVDLISGGINPEWARNAVLVPIPPSKGRNNPLYDDRIAQICMRVSRNTGATYRDILTQNEDLESFHDGRRLPPSSLAGYYRINESLIHPTPGVVGIVDDVLTTGCHFKAVQLALASVWPNVDYVGIFLARVERIQPSTHI